MKNRRKTAPFHPKTTKTTDHDGAQRNHSLLRLIQFKSNLNKIN